MKKVTIEEAARKLAKKHGLNLLEASAVQERIDDGWSKKDIKKLIELIKTGEIEVKKNEMVIEYHYKKPTTSEEKREQEVRLNRAFDLLFDEVMRRRAEKQ